MSWREVALGWLPTVRPAERDRVVFFVAIGAVVNLAQTVGLAGAEAIFLARVGADRLPVTFVLASAVTVAASLGYAVRVGRARNDRVLVELLALSSGALAAATAALHRGGAAGPTALLCLFFATQAVLTSHYWTLAGDFFDTLAAKRLVPLFTVGMSAGGAAGGGLAMAMMARAPAEALAWTWAGGFAVAGLGVLAARRRLTGWRPVADAEEDETSVAGMRAALSHLRRSALGRWLGISALAMVLALFVAQYLYSALFARAFPDEAVLASFLALYLAISNVGEIAVELAVTPWLIRRLGVPTANLAHPLLTLGAFAGLGLAPGLPAAVMARADREMLENALSGPVRNLVYNALPGRLRSRVRAFLEGIVIYSGMSVAGLALLATGPLGTRPLAAVGAALALLYALANVRVRREYVDAIAGELRAGRLDLRVLRDELGPRELAELADLWSHLIRAPGLEPDDALLALPELLAARGFAPAVRAGLAHPSPRLRAACLAALAAAAAAGADAELASDDWLAALADADPWVRRSALRALPAPAGSDPALAAALEARLADAEPAVRAAAAARLGAFGEPTFLALLDAEAPASVRAALEALPAALASRAADRVADRDPGVRAAALAALARTGAAAGVPLEALRARLADGEAPVRAAAVAALAQRDEPEALESLAGALRDGARAVRFAAVDALAARGDAGREAARPSLDAPEESAVGAALRVFGAGGGEPARATLRAAYAGRVREVWESWLLARAFASAAAPADAAIPFLAVACEDAAARALRIAFRVLAQLEDEAVVRSVTRVLRAPRSRGRADALEVLTHLGDRTASQALAGLLERAAFEDKLAPLRGLGVPPRDLAEARDRGRRHGAPWVRAAAHGTADSNAMQRLLALRHVSLLGGLSLERLQAVERIASDRAYARGERIVREGDPGDELFLLIEGQVDVIKQAGTPGEQRVNTLAPGDYFGEMAVLDGSPRSATLMATSDVRVLVLAGDGLRELVRETPDLAFDLLRVLAGRVRRAEERAGSGEG